MTTSRCQTILEKAKQCGTLTNVVIRNTIRHLDLLYLVGGFYLARLAVDNTGGNRYIKSLQSFSMFSWAVVHRYFDYIYNMRHHHHDHCACHAKNEIKNPAPQEEKKKAIELIEKPEEKKIVPVPEEKIVHVKKETPDTVLAPKLILVAPITPAILPPTATPAPAKTTAVPTAEAKGVVDLSVFAKKKKQPREKNPLSALRKEGTVRRRTAKQHRASE